MGRVHGPTFAARPCDDVARPLQAARPSLCFVPDPQVDYAALAAALVERLAPLMPQTLEISAVGSTVHLWQTDRSSGMYADLSKPSRRPLCDTLENVVDQLQDQVAEDLTEPWPAMAPDPMPMPFVRIDGDALLVGFGDPSDPVLALPPIPLTD
jgi:hypothetical protein